MKNINFKKQRNNKKKITNIKRGLLEKVRLVGGVCQKVNKTNRALRVILIQMFMKVFTHHEIIYRIPICVHNKNCGIMRTYIPCYIRSEEKVPLTQNCSKTQLLNKRNTYLLNMLSAISFISVFYYSTSCVALLNKSVSGQLPPG